MASSADLDNGQHIERPGGQIEGFDFAAHFLELVLSQIETFCRILDAPDALLRPLRLNNLGRHLRPPLSDVQ